MCPNLDMSNENFYLTQSLPIIEYYYYWLANLARFTQTRLWNYEPHIVVPVLWQQRIRDAYSAKKETDPDMWNLV